MRILFVELLSPKGHRKTNNKFIEYLCKIDKNVHLDLIFREGYMDYEDNNSIKKIIYFPEEYYEQTNKIKHRINIIKLLTFMYKELDVSGYDVVFISSYETISTSLFFKYKKVKSKIYLFNHNNIAETLNSRVKKMFFKLINKDIIHLVYDENIKSFLQNELNINNKISVIHHPLFGGSYKNKIPQNLNTIFSPSNSNTDEMITRILDALEKSESNIKMYIKSRRLEQLGNNIQVSPKWLSALEYEGLFSKSKAILLIFDNDFKYRASGVFFEAIAQNKYIITNSKYLYNTYICEYNNIGCYYKDSEELLQILKRFEDLDVGIDQFDGIKKTHNDDYILNQLRESILE